MGRNVGSDLGIAILGVALFLIGVAGVIFTGTYFVAIRTGLPTGWDIIDNTMKFLTANSNSPTPTIIWGIISLVCLGLGFWFVKYSLKASNN